MEKLMETKSGIPKGEPLKSSEGKEKKKVELKTQTRVGPKRLTYPGQKRDILGKGNADRHHGSVARARNCSEWVLV